MGETNAIVGRRSMVSRDVLIAADAIYRGISHFHQMRLYSLSGCRNVRKRRRNGAGYVPDHLLGTCILSDDLATLTMKRLDGSLHLRSLSLWREAQPKRT